MISNLPHPVRVLKIDAVFDGHTYVYEFPETVAEETIREITFAAADPDHPMPWIVANALHEKIRDFQEWAKAKGATA